MDDDYKRKSNILFAYQDLQKRVVALSYELTKWGTIGTGIQQRYEQGFGGGDVSSKPEIAGAGLAEVTQKIKAELQEATKARDKIKQAIDSVKNRRYRAMLTYRFINGMSCSEVATMIGKTERSVYMIIKHAVKLTEV